MGNNTFPAPYVPDATLRRCYDCAHMKSALSWWCKNPQAVEARGTAIPGIHSCPFWAPAHVYQTPTSLLKRLWKWIIK